MFKILGLKWKKEFENLKSLHDIALSKASHDLKLKEEELTQKHSLREKELVKTHEISLLEATSLLKLEYQQQLKQKEIDHQRAINELKAKHALDKAEYQQRLQDESYTRLRDAMTKLHEEGNVTTKFTHDLALKMLDKVPVAKSEHKYLQGEVNVNAGTE